jgi:hypothetical protein
VNDSYAVTSGVCQFCSVPLPGCKNCFN